MEMKAEKAPVLESYGTCNIKLWRHGLLHEMWKKKKYVSWHINTLSEYHDLIKNRLNSSSTMFQQVGKGWQLIANGVRGKRIHLEDESDTIILWWTCSPISHLMSVVKNAQHTPLTRAIMCQHEYHLHASGPWHRWIRRVCKCECVSVCVRVCVEVV